DLGNGPRGVFNPCWLDRGYLAGPQAGSLNELCSHHKVVTLLKEPRTGKYCKAGAASTLVVFAVFVSGANVGQQAGQQGAVETVVVGHRIEGFGLLFDANFAGDLAQLAN